MNWATMSGRFGRYRRLQTAEAMEDGARKCPAAICCRAFEKLSLFLETFALLKRLPHIKTDRQNGSIVRCLFDFRHCCEVWSS